MHVARLLVLLIGASLAQGDAGSGTRGPVTVKNFTLVDIKGKRHDLAEWKKSRAVVLFFLGTECPVSNGYAPEYIRLATAFAARNVVFFGVHPDPEVSAEVAAKHAKEYGLPFTILLDPAQEFTRQVGVRVVPEAAVFSPSGRLLYRGRIDDRYSLDGKRREVPHTRDLELALHAVTDGKKPPVPQTRAFGCPLPEPKKADQPGKAGTAQPKNQNGILVFETGIPQKKDDEPDASFQVISRFGFKVVTTETASGKKKNLWMAATEDDYRQSEAKRLGIKPEEAKLSCFDIVGGCYQTGPLSFSPFCPPGQGGCKVVYNPRTRHYYYTCY
jgi:peroxiredoxin